MILCFASMLIIKQYIINGEVKRVKKLNVVICCVILCASLGGCMSREERLTRELGSDQRTSDQITEAIVAALDAKDANALKELFSDSTLQEATDLDQQINDIMDFYQGKMVNYSGDANSKTHIKYGEEEEKELTGYYELTTDKEIYEIGYIYTSINKEYLEKVGLSKLEIVKKSLYDQEDFHWQFFKNGVGAYMQD